MSHRRPQLPAPRASAARAGVATCRRKASRCFIFRAGGDVHPVATSPGQRWLGTPPATTARSQAQAGAPPFQWPDQPKLAGPASRHRLAKRTDGDDRNSFRLSWPRCYRRSRRIPRGYHRAVRFVRHDILARGRNDAPILPIGQDTPNLTLHWPSSAVPAARTWFFVIAVPPASNSSSRR